MPRKKTVRTNLFPYHIVTRSNLKTWFQLPLNEVWELALNSLIHSNKVHAVSIHAFVLMSNHYHLVLDTPDSNIDNFMYEFNKRFSLYLRQETGHVNRMFGGRYKWSLIEKDIYYYNVIKYVYLNPVKAKICERPEIYPYSTLFYHVNQHDFPLPLVPRLNPNNGGFLDWLGKGHSLEQSRSISLGLKKTGFKFVGSREVRKPPEFDRWVSV